MPRCGMFVWPRLPQGIEGQVRGRPTAGVEPVQLAGPGVVHDREQVAAHAAGHRRDDPHDGIGGDGGVHGVAALGQDLSAGLRGERMLAGDDAVRREHHRTPLEALGAEHSARHAEGQRADGRKTSG